MMYNNIACEKAKENGHQSSQLGNDFREHVINGWHNVYPPVQQRMDNLLTSKNGVTFSGTGCVKHSKIGWVFAQMSRVLGGPLVRGQGENVKTIIRVMPTKNGLRCWHRLFVFEDGTQQLVETSKVVDPKMGVLDAVGKQGEKRLATKMMVIAEGKSLLFKSTGYMLRFKRFNLHIPMILTPGVLTAKHEDLGGGDFRYTLAFDHPVWGQTFYQDGVFSEDGE